MLVAAFASCKKDGDDVTYEGATKPTLVPSSTQDLVLTKPTAQQHAVTFSWDNPEFQFSSGVNSQDVTYYLQIDQAGANFSSQNDAGLPAIGEIVIAKELSIELTDSLLNGAIAAIGENGLAVDVPHNVEFRIKATVNGHGPFAYSNVVTIRVTPYLDVAVPIPPTGELYLTGSGAASGWTNHPPVTQKFTQVSLIEYEIVVDLQPNLQLKFLSTLDFWQPQYGLKTATPGSDVGGLMGFNMGGGSDPTEIPTPSIAGTYKITALFGPGKYKFELQ